MWWLPGLRPPGLRCCAFQTARDQRRVFTCSQKLGHTRAVEEVKSAGPRAVPPPSPLRAGACGASQDCAAPRRYSDMRCACAARQAHVVPPNSPRAAARAADYWNASRLKCVGWSTYTGAGLLNFASFACVAGCPVHPPPPLAIGSVQTPAACWLVRRGCRCDTGSVHSRCSRRSQQSRCLLPPTNPLLPRPPPLVVLRQNVDGRPTHPSARVAAPQMQLRPRVTWGEPSPSLARSRARRSS